MKKLLLIGLLSMSSLASAQTDVLTGAVSTKLNCDVLTEAAWDIAKSAQNGEPIGKVAEKYNEIGYSGEMGYFIDLAIYESYSKEIKETEKEKFLSMYDMKLRMFSRCIN